MNYLNGTTLGQMLSMNNDFYVLQQEKIKQEKIKQEKRKKKKTFNSKINTGNGWKENIFPNGNPYNPYDFRYFFQKTKKNQKLLNKKNSIKIKKKTKKINNYPKSDNKLKVRKSIKNKLPYQKKRKENTMKKYAKWLEDKLEVILAEGSNSTEHNFYVYLTRLREDFEKYQKFKTKIQSNKRALKLVKLVVEKRYTLNKAKRIVRKT
ncbi:hypothetical protein ACFL2K_04280 [Candidatus Margulisiibacteriota bacterium]